METRASPSPPFRLGIRANLGQFVVQTVLVFFVGITVGLERNVVPVLAKEEFAIVSTSVILSFVVSFGFVKALLNLLGGRLSESWGRGPGLEHDGDLQDGPGGDQVAGPCHRGE